MMPTMVNLISPEIVATEVEMMRAATNRVIVILEGEHDTRVYRKFFDFSMVEVVASYGKENAVGAVEILNTEKRISEYLGIVDADFDNLLSATIVDNIVRTDHHDIEITILKSTAFDRIVKEYCTSKKTRVDTGYSSLADYLMERVYFLSLLRFVNAQCYNHLCFEDIKYERFISKTDLNLDTKKCMRTVLQNTINRLDLAIQNACDASRKKKLEATKGSLPSIEEITDVMSNYIGRDTFPLEQISNGHDIIAVFSIALRKLFATADSKIVEKENMHKLFRLSFDSNDFRATKQYESIGQWEFKNKTILAV